MKTVFFDTECANCFDGRGKICELGYIVCDENFNVIERENLIINPDAPFDKKGFAMRKIKLSLPYGEYGKRDTFPSFYEKIKKIFSEKDVLVVGHGTHFDAQYILYECERYSLSPFDYRYIDTQEVVEKLYQRDKNLRLIELYDDFYPEKAREQLHSGIDDAEMTMEVLKYVIKDKKISLDEIIKKGFLCDVFEGRIVEGNTFGYSDSPVMGKKNQRLFDMCVKENNLKCNGESYTFPSEYEHRHFPQMLLIVSEMTKRNLRYSVAVKRGFYVTVEKNEWKQKYAKKNKIIAFEDFLPKIGYDVEKLASVEIDVEKIIAELDENRGWYKRFSEYKRESSL